MVQLTSNYPSTSCAILLLILVILANDMDINHGYTNDCN